MLLILKIENGNPIFWLAGKDRDELIAKLDKLLEKPRWPEYQSGLLRLQQLVARLPFCYGTMLHDGCYFMNDDPSAAAFDQAIMEIKALAQQRSPKELADACGVPEEFRTPEARGSTIEMAWTVTKEQAMEASRAELAHQRAGAIVAAEKWPSGILGFPINYHYDADSGAWVSSFKLW